MAQQFQMVRVDVDLLERIDGIKDPMVPRDPFIRAMLVNKLDEIEANERAKRRRKLAKRK